MFRHKVRRNCYPELRYPEGIRQFLQRACCSKRATQQELPDTLGITKLRVTVCEDLLNVSYGVLEYRQDTSVATVLVAEVSCLYLAFVGVSVNLWPCINSNEARILDLRRPQENFCRRLRSRILALLEFKQCGCLVYSRNACIPSAGQYPTFIFIVGA